MPKLPYTLKEFDENAWKAIFGAYVAANHSHWAGPPAELIARILDEKGEYRFGFEALGTWTSKLYVFVGKDGYLHARFERNPALSERMQQKLDKMEKVFLASLPK